MIRNLSPRIKRLETLSAGLAREIACWREGMDPALYLERVAYLSALKRAIAGLEEARLVLAGIGLRQRQQAQERAREREQRVTFGEGEPDLGDIPPTGD